MPGVEPVRKRNSSLRDGRPPDTDERVEQMARLIAGPVPCWCPDDWREPFDKAACPLHGGQEWPAGFHRERVREFLATDAPSPSPPEPAPDVDAIIDRLEASAFGVHAATHVRLEDAVAAVREAAGQPDWREVVAWLRSDTVEVVRVRLADLIEGRFGEAVGERKERADA